MTAHALSTLKPNDRVTVEQWVTSNKKAVLVQRQASVLKIKNRGLVVVWIDGAPAPIEVSRLIIKKTS